MGSENGGEWQYSDGDEVQVQPRGLTFDTRVPQTGRVVDHPYCQKSNKVAVKLNCTCNHLEFVHKFFVDTQNK